MSEDAPRIVTKRAQIGDALKQASEDVLITQANELFFRFLEKLIDLLRAGRASLLIFNEDNEVVLNIDVLSTSRIQISPQLESEEFSFEDHKIEDLLIDVGAYQRKFSSQEMAVPIKIDDEVVGMLNVEGGPYIDDEESTEFRESDFELLEILAQQIAIATKMFRASLTLINPQLRLSLSTNNLKTYGFSINYLSKYILPYINAISELNSVIDEINGRSPTNIEILAIRKGSVTVDITGGIRDTFELIFDNIVPWRRENHKKLKQAEAEQKEADAKKAHATIEGETEKIEAEAELLRAQVEKQKLENQKTQLEIMKLTIDMLKQIAPNLTEERRLLYAMKLYDPVKLIALSPLELTDVKNIEGDEIQSG
jgi:hypothetical protein